VIHSLGRSSSVVDGTEWPILCWCAVKKLLTHSVVDASCKFSRLSLILFVFSYAALQLTHNRFYARISYSNYLRQGGNVFARLSLSVCLSVCVLAR